MPKWDLFGPPNFTMPFNVAGYPAISVCAGFGAGGLPVAIQLVGKPFQEATLFRDRRRFRKGDPVPRQAPGVKPDGANGNAPSEEGAFVAIRGGVAGLAATYSSAP